MSARLVAAALLAMSGGAAAQPGTTGMPAPAPAPAEQPAPPPQWYRFNFVDGRFVDGVLVGQDATTYHVQIAGGAVYSLLRTNVLGVVPLQMGAPQQPAFAPQPVFAPPPVAPAPAIDEARGRSRNRLKFRAGVGLFAVTYGMTAVISLARMEEDDDAKLGLVPVIGPILWSASDDDKWGSDGYDWISFMVTFLQAGAVIGMLTSYESNDPAPPPPRAGVAISPVAGPGFGGVTVGGFF